jgi:uridine kinase
VSHSTNVLDELTGVILTKPATRSVAVAIDGPDAAGKTTFADRLGRCLAEHRRVVRVQADHFENPRRIRFRRGAASPEGYFEDTYDFHALETKLFEPLQSGLPIVTATFDWETDVTVDRPPEPVPQGTVVIIDGGFLLQKRFCHYFDLTILLEADEQVRLERAIPRQLARLGSAEAVLARFRTRYIPGYQLYLEREDPLARADYVIDNSDFSAPRVKHRPSS